MRHVPVMAAIGLAMLCALVMLAPAQASAATPPAHQGQLQTFTIAAVDIDSVPFWLPSTVEVYQGDRVRLILKNVMGGEPSVHGFAIPAYHIAVLVPHGATKTLEFTADKVGIFRYICQIHAGHIGGQLIVLPRHLGGVK